MSCYVIDDLFTALCSFDKLLVIIIHLAPPTVPFLIPHSHLSSQSVSFLYKRTKVVFKVLSIYQKMLKAFYTLLFLSHP